MIHRARLGLDELSEDEHLVADLKILSMNGSSTSGNAAAPSRRRG